MASWQVDPAGVDDVLARVHESRADVEAALRPLQHALASVAKDADGDAGEGLVTHAIADLVDALTPKTAAMVGRIAAASAGAGRAKQAVEAGDEQMAGDILATTAQVLGRAATRVRRDVR